MEIMGLSNDQLFTELDCFCWKVTTEPHHGALLEFVVLSHIITYN